MSNPTQNHGDAWTGGVEAKSGGGQSEVSQEEIQADLKSIEEMREDIPTKEKGLRHQPSMYAAKKRKHKMALQKAARKRQRGK